MTFSEDEETSNANLSEMDEIPTQRKELEIYLKDAHTNNKTSSLHYIFKISTHYKFHYIKSTLKVDETNSVDLNVTQLDTGYTCRVGWVQGAHFKYSNHHKIIDEIINKMRKGINFQLVGRRVEMEEVSTWSLEVE